MYSQNIFSEKLKDMISVVGSMHIFVAYLLEKHRVYLVLSFYRDGVCVPLPVDLANI
jgi:hypothetical protein